MLRPPPSANRTDTFFPFTTLFRSFAITLQFRLVALLLGHLLPLNEYANDPAVVLDDRLQNKIQNRFLWLLVRMASQEQRYTFADIRLTGAIDLVEQTDEEIGRAHV